MVVAWIARAPGRGWWVLGKPKETIAIDGTALRSQTTMKPGNQLEPLIKQRFDT